MSEHGIIEGLSFNLPFNNVDTDQIYPGRYLTTITREGLGELCFHDWRHDPSAGKQGYFEDFDPARQPILVSGHNFGCGSSREHAAWALRDLGIRAIVSSRFADIFKSNAAKNSLLLVTVEAPALEYLLANDRLLLRIDIGTGTLAIPGFGTVRFPVDAFTAHCLLNDIDALSWLLAQEEKISAWEQSRSTARGDRTA